MPLGSNTSGHLFDTTFNTNGALYSAASGVVTSTASANTSILLTDGSGVPSLGTTLANSFSFAASSSGATVSTTVSNTSNTASSNALQQVTVAGTSAGDAFTTYTISGTTNWSVGTDNSVTGDPFVIAASTALGTTNVMSSTTGGAINYPLQPAFLAVGTGQASATGDGTVVTVTFATEIFDAGSNFSSPTFTAPVTGHYFLNSLLTLTGLSALFTTGTLNIVTSNRTYIGCDCFIGVIRDASNNASIGGVILADMDAADTVTITLTVSGSTKTVTINGSAPNTTFSGFLQG